MKNKNFIALIISGLPFTFIDNINSQDFSLVVIPDTQNMTNNHPNLLYSQFNWISEKRDSLNIVHVSHVGDCVHGGMDLLQWNRADTAFKILENSEHFCEESFFYYS